MFLCECYAHSYPKNNWTHEFSVAIDPSWQILEEIEFHRLAKLRLEVNSTSPQI
ncbi:hypothetical protein V8E53_009795 [Lactarius tabidus]